MNSIQVIYEDNHLLVVNKPGGMLVQGDQTGDITLLDWGKAYIKKKYNKPGEVFLGLPHRIDRVTSGLVIMCRTSKSLSRVTQGFKNRAYQKEYVAVISKVKDLPQSGIWEDWLFKDHQKNKSFVVRDKSRIHQKAVKEAKLQFELVGVYSKYMLLKFNLLTGRHHQIRVQCAQHAAPILGDKKYGSPEGYGHYIALHARRLSGIHPVRKDPFQFMAPTPSLVPWNHVSTLIKSL